MGSIENHETIFGDNNVSVKFKHHCYHIKIKRNAINFRIKDGSLTFRINCTGRSGGTPYSYKCVHVLRKYTNIGIDGKMAAKFSKIQVILLFVIALRQRAC